MRRSPDGLTVVAVARWGSTHLRWHVVGEDPDHVHHHGWRCDRDVEGWEIVGSVPPEPAV